MTEAAEATFLDTNILVYASVDSSPFHSAALKAITELENTSDQVWISRQVMREYLATLVRPKVGIALDDLTEAIRSFELRYQIAEDSILVTAQLLTLLEQNLSRQVHDTNIVATMIAYGIGRIITNNPDDFTPFSSLITVIPLV